MHRPIRLGRGLLEGGRQAQVQLRDTDADRLPANLAPSDRRSGLERGAGSTAGQELEPPVGYRSHALLGSGEREDELRLTAGWCRRRLGAPRGVAGKVANGWSIQRGLRQGSELRYPDRTPPQSLRHQLGIGVPEVADPRFHRNPAARGRWCWDLSGLLARENSGSDTPSTAAWRADGRGMLGPARRGRGAFGSRGGQACRGRLRSRA